MTDNAPHRERIKVLVVDDRLENLLAITTVLSAPDLHIVTADSGAEALRVMLQEEVALVLLDVLMPQMDGLETASLIHAREATRHVPIIFLTAAGDDVAMTMRGYKVGAVDYLLKPFDPDMLRAKVRVFADLHHKTRAIERRQEALRRQERLLSEAALERSEALLEATFREADVGVGHLDAQGVWVRANRRLGDLLGRPQGELLGRRLCDHLLPLGESERATVGQVAPVAGALYKRAVGARQPSVFALNFSDLTGKAGELAATVCVVEDISARWRAALRQGVVTACSAQLLGASEPSEMVEAMAAAVAPSLGDWCFVEALSDDGRTVGAVAGRHVGGAGQGHLDQMRARLLAAPSVPIGRELAAEVPWSSAAGPRPPASGRAAEVLQLLAPLGTAVLTVVPLVARGSPLGWLLIGTGDLNGPPQAEDFSTIVDLGHRLALALDNARLLAEARRGLAVRDEFMSVASHELRTPLTPLLLQLQRLRPRGAAPTDAAASRTATIARSAERQVQRLVALVDDLLDVTRISAGWLEIHPAEVDLSVAAREVAQRFGERLSEAKSDLGLQAAAEVVGFWDPARVDQVIVNLLSNAIKYGNGQPIELAVTQADGQAHLTVRDHGIGIPAARVPHIFGRFERAASPRRHGGLGLGLYIVERIVQAHHGRIEVVSDEARGSAFTVVLPLEPPGLRRAAAAAAAALRA